MISRVRSASRPPSLFSLTALRVFLCPLLTLLALLAAATDALAAAAPGKARPNILFVIADDWSWAHTSIAGDPLIKTPHFDRVAREGVYFPRAFCSSPSCTPSRAALLTGQAFCRLEEGGNLLSTLDKKFAVYPDLLEAAGYKVGYTGKGWDPGVFEAGGRTRNPAGPVFNSAKLQAPTANTSSTDYAKNLELFLAARERGQPFCFWIGTNEPHRPYEAGSGLRAGKRLADVKLPSFLPDAEVVRCDFLDYALKVEWLDTQLGRALAVLEAAGELDNTLVVVTADNGMPFQRAKMNVYDYGTRLPLAMRWPARVPGGRTVDDFVSHTDFAPTILEAAGLQPPSDMTGRSLLPLLTSGKSGRIEPARDRVFVGRERHDIFRPGPEGNFLGYPVRALRTEEFLYILNFAPDRVPAADSLPVGDADRGPTRSFFAEHRDDPKIAPLHRLSFGLRPAEELYELATDPEQMNNVAGQPRYAAAQRKLRAELEKSMKDLRDPRAFGQGDTFDRYPPRQRKAAPASAPKKSAPPAP